MGEAVYTLTQEQLNRLVTIASNAGIRAYRKEAKKAEKRLAKATDKVEITKRKLKNYRPVKKKVGDEAFSKDELEELRFEYLEDLMGQHGLEGRAEKKRDAELWSYILNVDSIRKIDKAYEQYRTACEKWGTEDEKRRCREIYMLYMDEKVYRADDIARIECVSRQTVYRDIGIASKKLAAYLLGF